MPAPVVKKLQCECGSTFFFTVRSEQFAAGGYGTAEFRSMSQAPKTFLVCLCGRPTFPQPTSFAQGTVASIAEKEFQESAKCAKDAIASTGVSNIANLAASPAEVADLRKQIEDLKQTLAALGTKEYAADVKEAKTRRPRAKSSEAREVPTNGAKA